jgi:tetratricopeptide (TPR) repeat protein
MGQAAVNRLLREAVEHYDCGRPNEAEALCGDILTAQPDHVAALHLSAVIAFITDRAAEGAVLLSRVFSVDPDHAPALATLGDALAVKGEQEAAVAAFQRAVKARPQDAGLHAKLGSALCDLSRFDAAETSYRRAIKLDPHSVRTRFNLAVALAGQKRLAEAEDVYRTVIARDPAHRDAWLNLGNVLIDQDKVDDAVAAYRRALAADPDDAAIHCNLGVAFRQLGEFDDAIMHCRRATRLAPGDVAKLRVLGLTLFEAGRLDDAVQAYRQASTLDPGDPLILSDLAVCLCELQQFEEAITACDLALALDPDHAPAHTNLGLVLEAQDDIEAAIAAHRRAIAANPDYAKGHANLAHALRSSGRIDDALAASHRAVALDPELPQARFNHAHYLLLNGDLKQGFVDYRWERKCKSFPKDFPKFSEPEWQGEAFSGRTLLLFAEQGLGDTLQFVRYVPMAAEMGGAIVLQVQPALASLLRTIPGLTVISRGEPLPPFDLQLPLMSLARVFGTTLDTIPAAIPYLQADPAKCASWRRALNGATLNKTPDNAASLKIGVVWAGNPKHPGDRSRSLSAEAVLPRLVMPGVQLYSLQKEPRAAEVAVLARLGADIIDLALELGDFADTAAAIAALDLVITVDTSVAHLAGALGRPVWVLMPHSLDWRWLRNREDSPWYPTMRLFRQHEPRAWEHVLARVSSELARVAAGERELIWPPSKAN